MAGRPQVSDPRRVSAPTATAPSPAEGAYRWYILALAALTHTLVVGMPMMSLPVLFDEIGTELSLNLVQIGYVWGAASLLGVAMSLTGGVIGDRVGARRMLVFACLLSGVTGATRAFASDYVSLTATVLVAGLFPMAAPMNVHKTCGVWFSGKRLGMANGVVSAGMALGFLLGSLISATILSPLLGGWRNVLLFYAVLAVIVGTLWAFTRPGPDGDGRAIGSEDRPSLRESLLRVGRLRNVWLLALAMFGIGGAIQGSLGYLPLYLRNEGWDPNTADSALASFHFASLLFTVPFTLLSDRLGVRRPLLLASALMLTVGFGLLSFVQGIIVWLAVIFAGITRDGYMATMMTLIIELRGVGPAFAGTATGFIMAISRIGSVVAPPLGNGLESFGAGLPFLFWAALALVGFAALTAVHEEGRTAVVRG